MAYARLLAACWRDAAGLCTPLAVTQLIIALWQDGFSWVGVGEQLADCLLSWGAASLVWAAVGCLLLQRRAREAGVPLGVGALAGRQT